MAVNSLNGLENVYGANNKNAGFNPVDCKVSKEEDDSTIMTFNYENGAEKVITYKNGEYTMSGKAGNGAIGAFTGYEMTEDEAKEWMLEEISKLPQKSDTQNTENDADKNKNLNPFFNQQEVEQDEPRAIDSKSKFSFKNGKTTTITYSDGSQRTLGYKNGKYTMSGKAGEGAIGAFTGYEMTEDEAKEWLVEQNQQIKYNTPIK